MIDLFDPVLNRGGGGCHPFRRGRSHLEEADDTGTPPTMTELCSNACLATIDLPFSVCKVVCIVSLMTRTSASLLCNLLMNKVKLNSSCMILE